MKVSAEEIENGKTKKGGWDKITLAKWGVPWPPPKGWKESLISGTALGAQTFSTEAMRGRHSGSLEAKLLQRVVMAMIENGYGDILKEIDELMIYYGSKLPTVAEIIGGRPKNAVIKGEIGFDDKVYRFECARTVK